MINSVQPDLDLDFGLNGADFYDLDWEHILSLPDTLSGIGMMEVERTGG